jgi:hypothetical protein
LSVSSPAENETPPTKAAENRGNQPIIQRHHATTSSSFQAHIYLEFGLWREPAIRRGKEEKLASAFLVGLFDAFVSAPIFHPCNKESNQIF